MSALGDDPYGALLRRLWDEEGVTWSGRYRPPLVDVTTQPRPGTT